MQKACRKWIFFYKPFIRRTGNPLFLLNEPNVSSKRTQSTLFTKKHNKSLLFLANRGTSVRKHKELAHFVTDKGTGVHQALLHTFF